MEGSIIIHYLYYWNLIHLKYTFDKVSLNFKADINLHAIKEFLYKYIIDLSRFKLRFTHVTKPS